MSRKGDQLWFDAWYGKRRWTYLLLPLMWLYRLITVLRRAWLTRFAQGRLSVPVVVVGNITLGGTGKTPLLLAMVAHLQTRGRKPGVVSRGYGGCAPEYPFLVTDTATAAQVGDEPLHIWQRLGCPVAVGPDRLACAQLLLTQGCDLILSDDGLQHYRLGRDLEILVVDATRGFGNGQCLPVGPLREPLSRVAEVDMVVMNGESLSQPVIHADASYLMKLTPRHWQRLTDNRTLPLTHLPPGTRVHVVAGIGNPQRFYQTLANMQLELVEHDFPDHHAYDASDFDFMGDFKEPLPLVMTAKDAVKCRAFAQDSWYALQVHADLPETFWTSLDAALSELPY